MATFEDRCGDFRRSMYRLSKIDDRCHDVSTIEDYFRALEAYLERRFLIRTNLRVEPFALSWTAYGTLRRCGCPCCNGPRYRWAQWTRFKVVGDRCYGTTRAKVTISLFRTRPPKIIYPASGACFREEEIIIFGPWGRLNWRGALIRSSTVHACIHSHWTL